jgi:hypothetical protein
MAVIMRWSTTNRFGISRNYQLEGDVLMVRCHGVSSYALSTDDDQNVISIDPTGGPMFYVGQRIEHGDYSCTIKSIMYHYKNKSVAVFMFGV